MVERELDALAKSMPNVEVLQGHSVVLLSQNSELVQVEGETDFWQIVQGRYLIGADRGKIF